MESTFDLHRIQSETFVQCVEYRQSVASTNDLAKELVRDASRSLPLLVLAEQQTQGRGRGLNRWWSSEGALTFTLVLDTRDAAPQAGDVPLVSLVAALAICEALDQLHSTEAFRLKWPNDVLAGRRKVTGILAEVPARPRDRMLIGIGINVNNSLNDAPRELQQQATSLADLAGRPFGLTDVLVRVLGQLNLRLADFACGNLRLGQTCAAWCALTGRTVEFRAGRRRVVGTCQGIDDNGALVIDCDGVESFLSGVIQRVDWDE